MENNGRYECIECIGNQTSDGVFVFNLPEKKFLYTNPAFRDFFKLKEEQNTDVNSVLQCILSEDQGYLQSRYQELVDNGTISGTEFRLDTGDGQVRHFYCDIYRLEDGKALIGFVKDFTKNKEHENFLVEYTAKKDTFLDMITHNLAGPLNLSQNILGWIDKSLLNKQNTDALIAMLQESIQECIEIVNDFLKEEHHDSQMTIVRKTRFDVVEKLNVIVQKIKELNPDKNFFVVTRTDIPNINSDAIKFFQVIHNLLSNAIKFTPPGGNIYVTVEEEKDHYNFSVRDNGIGIPEKLKPYVFERRSMARREGLKGEKPNGIGLYVIKKLVEMIGGTIWFISEENKGSAFFVRLPKE